MKIQKVDWEQFAGIRDKSLSFSDGMNVILGDNESGKSTLISAMFHGLTMPSKLDKRREKDFIRRCFPTDGADTIDVTMTLQKDGRQYIAEKIWDLTGEETLSKLKQEGGSVLRGGKAEKKLQELLVYGPATYSNLVFGRQDHEKEILAWCYDFFGPGGDPEMETAKKTVAAAFSAVGGLSPDCLFSALEEKMKALSGHWDMERDRPDRGRDLDNPWATGKGKILEAYYAYREAEQAYQKGTKIEQESQQLTEQLSTVNEELRNLHSLREQLIAQQGQVEDRAKTQRLLDAAQDALQCTEEVQRLWPSLEKRVERGKDLMKAQEEAKNSEKREVLQQKIRNAEGLEQEISSLEEWLLEHPTLPEDFKEAQRLARSIENKQSRLMAVKLRTHVTLEEAYVGKVQCPDGSWKALSVGDTRLDADGFVHLLFPGVAEIRVYPGDLDAEALQKEIRIEGNKLEALLKTYGVLTEAALGERMEQYQKKMLQLEMLRQSQSLLLDGNTIEQLGQQRDEIPLLETNTAPETLEADVVEYLKETGKPTLESAVAAEEVMLQSYCSQYGERTALEGRCAELREECHRYQRDLATPEPICDLAEYRQKMDELEMQLQKAEPRRAEILQQLGSLSVQEQIDRSELEAEMQRLKKHWEAEKQTYRNYQEIKRDLEQMQEQTEDQLAGFMEVFEKNLSLLTGDRISADRREGLMLQSGRNQLTMGELLSEGTQKTVALAFRLAVLDAFFPDGGGLLVLDDDLLDMDPDRRCQAANLLKRFAERNQVLFTTCDPAIADLLGGNLVKMS